MSRGILTVVLLAVLGGAGYAYYAYTRTAPPPAVVTAAVTEGPVADTVGATGTLQAVTTVQVGTQVSGTIRELHADFNSLVRRGQVLARLDPSLFETQIEQARANLIRAQADLDRLRVALADAETKLARARELAGRELIPQSELDNADVAVRSAQAQIQSSEAQVIQAEASLNQNRVNLQHTVITAPIDGLVISRNVDVGQTVAASMQAPTLFVLAADLTKMQVLANLDESDVGRIRPRQVVTFRVDAYPSDDFTGAVSQVRLQPQVVQNVVTYSTVIDVPNPQLKLKPGMTANVNIEIARVERAIRVPNAALRFRPTNDIFAALGQSPPEPGAAAGARTGGPPHDGAGSGPAGPEDRTARAEAAGGNGRGRGRTPAQMRERLQELPPEQREQVLQRMRARGFDPTRGGEDSGPSAERGPDQAAERVTPLAARSGATTIDALFGPLPPVESVGRVWIYQDGELRPIRVRLGISDGQATALLGGPLEAGTELVTSVTTGNETRPAAAGSGNPFMPQPRFGRRPF